MKEFEGKFHRVKDGISYAAIVKINVEETETSYLQVKCVGDGWIAQGYLESATQDGYQDWKEGAVAGANYVLEKNNLNLGVVIKEICGMITDTSPAAVGAATAYAIWNAIEHTPTQDEIEHLESVVFSTDYESSPNF